MFWDGTRWIDERAPAATPPPTRRRGRDWLATGVMIIGVAALAVPFVATNAAVSSTHRLLASWRGSFETRVFQESTPYAAYSGSWDRLQDDQYLGSSAAVSAQLGASVTFTFTGSAVSWIGPEGPDQGKAAVYVDGEYVRTVDNYSRSFKPRETLFTTPVSQTTQHTLTIRARVTAAREAVSVDAFVVRGQPLEETSAQAPAPPADPTPAPPALAVAPPDPTPTPTPTPHGRRRTKPTRTARRLGRLQPLRRHRHRRARRPRPRPTPRADGHPGAHGRRRRRRPTATPTPRPTATPVPTPTATPTPRPTATPAPTATPTPTPTPTTSSCGSSLQAKVDAAPSGGTLDLTGCTYAAGATIGKPLTIVGARVDVPADQRGFIVTASNVTLDRLVITGAQATSYSWNEVGVLTTGSVSNLVVRDSTIRTFGNAGIWVGPSTNPLITGTTIEDTVYAGIMIISAAGGRVDGNVVRRVGVQGASANGNNAYGIAVSNQGGAVSSDVVVNGNTVATVPTWHGLDTHAGLRISFTNNTVSGAPRALFITSDGSGRKATDITVTGNRFLSPAPATTNLVTVTTYAATRVSVTGNTASGWGSASFFYDYQGQSTGLVVSGNTVTP